MEDLVLSLWSTDVAGLPGSARDSVGAAVCCGSGPFITFDLSVEAVAVSAGEVFAIVLNSDAGNDHPSRSDMSGSSEDSMTEAQLIQA